MAEASIYARAGDGDRRGGPLYLGLRKRIEIAIRDGLLQPGDALPSERELAIMADVSRVTVRKAVQHLVMDGLLVQRHGSGTFVAPAVPRVEQPLSALTSFTEDMERRGMSVETRWLDRGLYAPSPEETMVLGLSASDKVARVNRLRLADGTPFAIERAALSAAILPDPSAVGASLYEALEKSGMRPVRAIQRISAALLETGDAQLLGVAVGSASLNITRISYIASGKVVEFTRSRYRADAYDFVAELRLRDDGAPLEDGAPR